MANRFYQEPMKRHTTIRIGGPADELFIPENKQELVDKFQECLDSGTPCKIMGNGSNLLVRDEGVRGVIIKNAAALNYLSRSGNTVTAGSSVLLPKFVYYCVKNGLEGMEYLFSIPGTLGGALFMNAGRGQCCNQAISDRLVQVKVFDGQREFGLDRSDLAFSYRTSLFQKRRDWLILEATFLLKDQDQAQGMAKIKQRMELVRRTQPRGCPSAGSVYRRYSRLAFRFLRGLRIGGCQYETNWISNLGDGTARDALRLLRWSRWVHGLLLQKPELEIEIWQR